MLGHLKFTCWHSDDQVWPTCIIYGNRLLDGYRESIHGRSDVWTNTMISRSSEGTRLCRVPIDDPVPRMLINTGLLSGMEFCFFQDTWITPVVSHKDWTYNTKCETFVHLLHRNNFCYLSVTSNHLCTGCDVVTFSDELQMKTTHTSGEYDLILQKKFFT